MTLDHLNQVVKDSTFNAYLISSFIEKVLKCNQMLNQNVANMIDCPNAKQTVFDKGM